MISIKIKAIISTIIFIFGILLPNSYLMILSLPTFVVLVIYEAIISSGREEYHKALQSKLIKRDLEYFFNESKFRFFTIATILSFYASVIYSIYLLIQHFYGYLG